MKWLMHELWHSETQRYTYSTEEDRLVKDLSLSAIKCVRPTVNIGVNSIPPSLLATLHCVERCMAATAATRERAKT